MLFQVICHLFSLCSPYKRFFPHFTHYFWGTMWMSITTRNLFLLHYLSAKFPSTTQFFFVCLTLNLALFRNGCFPNIRRILNLGKTGWMNEFKKKMRFIRIILFVLFRVFCIRFGCRVCSMKIESSAKRAAA